MIGLFFRTQYVQQINEGFFTVAVINTNISAVITQNAMLKNDRDMQTTMERLSTRARV